MLNRLRKIRKDENSASALEYGLIAALVAVAAIGAMAVLSDRLSEIFQYSDAADLDAAHAAAR